jgi:hypothetical protein
MDKATVLSKYLTHVLPTLVLSPMPSVHWQSVASPAGFAQAADFYLGALPNRRIEHGVVQRKNLAARRHYIIQGENKSYISVSASGASRIRDGRGVS